MVAEAKILDNMSSSIRRDMPVIQPPPLESFTITKTSSNATLEVVELILAEENKRTIKMMDIQMM